MKSIPVNIKHSQLHVRLFSEANGQQHIQSFDKQLNNQIQLDVFDHNKQQPYHFEYNDLEQAQMPVAQNQHRHQVLK